MTGETGRRRVPLLQISDLRVEYRTPEGVVHAVNGLSLAIEEGSSLGLVGETGAGKTTTALCAMGLLPRPPGVITAGEILFRGVSVLSLGERQLEGIRGNQISIVFQNPMSSLNPIYPVGYQIAEVICQHQKIGLRAGLERAREMMRMVGIPDSRASDFPHQFSGGMRQRVMIAMALACRPALLIADEPTTALDVTIQAQVIALMKELMKKTSGALLLITHELGLVAELCNRVAVMYAGKIMEIGSLEQVFRRPLHPYTVGLFRSIPRLKAQSRRLSPIAGLSPDPKNLPTGCPFHPRCPRATHECSEEEPIPDAVDDGHVVSCWNSLGGDGIVRFNA
ncbi:MAG: ABC transporter ATP-binding protein [Firmicutes bacterium]|nr:ABC transporter ATP-binding protein [Bacillota bacterium]